MPGTSTMPTASALPTAPNGPTGQLATWIAGFTLDQAPPEVQQRAKYLLLDGFGCALVGAQLPWSRTAVQAVTAFEGKGDTPIIGWGATTGAPAAALLNATLIRALELDTAHPVGYVHSTSDVIPPMLSLAHLDSTISGASFVGAAIAGYESGPRASMGLHGGAAVVSRGWHPDPLFGNITTAVAVANILGLNAAQVEDALGHGCTQSFGLMATQYGAMSQRMLAGWSSRNGLYAGLLAKAGYTGIKQVFELSYGGWLSTFGEGHNPDSTQIASELGKRWETLREGVKPYACSGALDAAIDALFEVNAKRHLKAAEIASIDFEFNGSMYQHVWWPVKRPLSMTEAQLNIAYTAAVAVLDGEVLVQQFTPARINSDDVWNLIPRITAQHNTEWDKTTDPNVAFQSSVRVGFTDGTELDSYQAAPRAVTTPLSNDEIVTKFRNVTDGIIDTKRQADIEKMVLNLDKQSSLKALVELLAPPVKSPFET
jgi:2-methylcitrate dehydratase PrpD